MDTGITPCLTPPGYSGFGGLRELIGKVKNGEDASAVSHTVRSFYGQVINRVKNHRAKELVKEKVRFAELFSERGWILQPNKLDALIRALALTLRGGYCSCGGVNEMSKEPERTEDGRYIIVDGRRWRASDPSIPDALRQELVNELMSARRAVRSNPETARPRVHDAKVALGERGDPWWEPTEAGIQSRIEASIRALLRHREGSTICPSDAARVVGGEQWRERMPCAREIAYRMAREGIVRVQQRGLDVEPGDVRGPIRLAPGPRLGPE